MKNNFKEFWEGYKNWCKVGREKHYGNFMFLLLLPCIIVMCVSYYYAGKNMGKIESNLTHIHDLVCSKEDDKIDG